MHCRNKETASYILWMAYCCCVMMLRSTNCQYEDYGSPYFHRYYDYYDYYEPATVVYVFVNNYEESPTRPVRPATMDSLVNVKPAHLTTTIQPTKLNRVANYTKVTTAHSTARPAAKPSSNKSPKAQKTTTKSPAKVQTTMKPLQTPSTTITKPVNTISTKPPTIASSSRPTVANKPPTVNKKPNNVTQIIKVTTTAKPTTTTKKPQSTPQTKPQTKPPMDMKMVDKPKNMTNVSINVTIPASRQPATSATSLPSMQTVCGSHKKISNRIVGGTPVGEDDWPWMAALIRFETDQYCAGTLITDRHVLTASHCVHRWKESDVIVRLGEYDFNQSSQFEKDYLVDKIVAHKEYDRRMYRNDVAIIKLASKVIFNRKTKPICLPPSNLVLEGQSAYVAGWGTTVHGGSKSDILLEVLVPVWKANECKAAYNQIPISDRQICAGYKNGGKDSCQGDSGGPMMYETTPGRWAVVGIVSWGSGCGLPNKPGIYTSVVQYLDWIKDVILQ